MPPRLFGFADTKNRTLHDAEAGALRKAVARRLGNDPELTGAAEVPSDQPREGESKAAGAEWLNSQGFTGTLGKPFNSQTFGRLVANPTIAGLYRDVDGLLQETGNPGIITRSEFEALEALDAAVNGDHRLRDDAYPYFLSSVDLTVCGECCCPMQGGRSGAGSPGYRDKGPGACGKVRIGAKLLEEYVGEHIVAELLLPGNVEAMQRIQDELRTRIEADRARLKEIETTEAELSALVVARKITTAAYAEAEEIAGAEKRTIRRRLRFLEQAVDVPILGDVDELIRWWDTATPASKTGLALLMFHRIDVHPASARGIRTIEPGRVKLWWRSQPPPPAPATA
ncbi:hypothetical protein ACFVFS_39330 [Kitasatospora sp. NPDC057692]|uniref:hypothetical protein n=1 Tax=Kitasatospora sp. NPDC057692 TaxID=3346215 RepID=UPI0036965438